jgi:AcrR family transcriptional regulator
MSASTKKELGRQRILDAAREVFAEQGLDGASLRAIAARAGYTPAALYFHFESREAIYAELLRASLADLTAAIRAAAQGPEAFRAGALALFDFYAARPQALALGLYLGPGGPAPRGLGQGIDPALNALLLEALAPIRAAAAQVSPEPDALVAEIFAQAVGLLVLSETRRLRLFGLPARGLMERLLERMPC